MVFRPFLALWPMLCLVHQKFLDKMGEMNSNHFHPPSMTWRDYIYHTYLLTRSKNTLASWQNGTGVNIAIELYNALTILFTYDIPSLYLTLWISTLPQIYEVRPYGSLNCSCFYYCD